MPNHQTESYLRELNREHDRGYQLGVIHGVERATHVIDKAVEFLQNEPTIALSPEVRQLLTSTIASLTDDVRIMRNRLDAL